MTSNKTERQDPVYRSSLNEMRWILALWAVFFLWVIGYSSWYGYLSEGQPLVTVLGLPSWVFWGIFLPWVVSASVSCWFALTQIQDHPLDDSTDVIANDRESSDG